MDVMLAISLAQAAVTMAPQIKQLFSGGVAQVTPEKVASLLPTLAPTLKEFGGVVTTVATENSSETHPAIGAIAAFAPPDQVKNIQVMLNNYLRKSSGFTPLVLDGKMGAKTVSAIMRAQQTAGIPVDGLFGPNTLEAISHSQGK